MKSNSESNRYSKWMPATIAVIVVTMVTAMVEPAVFARNEDQPAKTDEHVAQPAAPAPLPNRSDVVAKIALAIPQAPPRAASTPAPRPSNAVPTAPQSKGKSKKWIWIAAAAGGGAVAAYALTRGNGTTDQPVITVGTPVVGGPQ